jgi:hypothetical protein
MNRQCRNLSRLSLSRRRSLLMQFVNPEPFWLQMQKSHIPHCACQYCITVPKPIASFTIYQLDNTQSVVSGVGSGIPGTFKALPVDLAGNLEPYPFGTTFAWTTSDPAAIARTDPSDPTGLTGHIIVGAPTAANFVLTCTGTLPDSTTVSGSVTVPYVTAPAGTEVPAEASEAPSEPPPEHHSRRRRAE